MVFGSQGIGTPRWRWGTKPTRLMHLVRSPKGNVAQDGRWNYTWDAENRLVSMTSRNGGDPILSITFEYDYQGRRTLKKVTPTVGSVTTSNFFYNGWNVIAEVDGSNTLLHSFVWGKDLSGNEQDAGGVGGLVALVVHTGGNAGTYFPSYDGNGNLTTLTKGSDGSLAARYEYSPFHKVIRATGPMAKEYTHLAATKYYDYESGLYYYGYRYYEPETGRWLSRDPIEENGGLNLYTFITNKPLESYDYLGLSYRSSTVRGTGIFLCWHKVLTFDGAF